MTTAAARSHAAPAPAAFAAEALAGLRASPKALSPKWFYDAAGSALFEEITKLPEYYPTRTEIAILRASAAAMTAGIEPGAALIEFGSGSSEKTPLILAALRTPRLYAPIDVSESALAGAAERLQRQFPSLPIRPIIADFAEGGALIRAAVGAGPRLGFFPGSTIGNFDPPAARRLLAQFGAALGPGAKLIIGVDAPKPVDVLLAAYDDRAGVTARFNKNLLIRMNRELGADFAPERFRHEARWNPERSRVEMHLVSLVDQVATVAGVRIGFSAGESLHTENSYKHAPADFLAQAASAGWRGDGHWTDPQGWFSVFRIALG